MYYFEETRVHYSACSDPSFSWPRLAGLLERYWPRFRSTLMVEAVRPDQMTLVHPKELEPVQGFYPIEEQDADMKGIARMLTTPFRWTGKMAEFRSAGKWGALSSLLYQLCFIGSRKPPSGYMGG